MKKRQFAEYKIVELDEDTVIIHCRDLRKGAKFVKPNRLRGVRRKGKAKEKTSKILFGRVPFKELAKNSSKSHANNRANKGLGKAKDTQKEVMKELALMMKEIMDEIQNNS